MGRRTLNSVLVAYGMAWLTAASVVAGAPQQGDASRLRNSVPPTPASIAAGRESFRRACASCHGLDAKGGHPFEEAIDPGPDPSDLIDAKWDYGSGDADIFVAIRDGVGPRIYMQPFADRFNAEQIWNIVNYLRSIGPVNRR